MSRALLERLFSAAVWMHMRGIERIDREPTIKAVERLRAALEAA